MFNLLIFATFTVFLQAASAKVLQLDPRIIGGEEAPDGRAPYQVSLRDNGRHFCGGSILNDRWVMTAAHCAGYPTTIVVGTNKISSGGQNYSVEKTIVHEKYDPALIKNDVALLKTRVPIVFGQKVQPIELAENNTIAGANLLITGWGTTSYPGTTPDALQMLNVSAVSVSACQQWFKGINPVWESEICAISKAGQGACHGDSGGPLVEGNRLVGVVSWAMPCARGFPDVYSRVYSFRDWILNQISANS